MPSQAPSTPDVTSLDSGPEAAAGDRADAAGPSSQVVGVVFGDVDADGFRFAVREPGLGRGDWVSVDHPQTGPVLARVEAVRRETSLSAREARRLDDPDEAAPDEQVTAQARVVGSGDAAGDPPASPVPAGAAVRRAPGSLLAAALGLPDPDGPRPRGAYLGKVRGRDVPVVLDVADLVRRHVSILAKTGAGKSYLVGVLLEELAKEGVPAVVVDPHGEHAGLARPNRDPDAFPRMREFGVEPRQYADALARFAPEGAGAPEAEALRLDAANLPRDELEQLAGDLTNAQQGVLHEALRDLRDRPAHYDLDDVVRRVGEHESSAKWGLLSRIESLAERPLFAGEPTDPGALVARGQVSLVELRGVDPDVAETAVARLANTLFEARKRGEVPPFLLVVEEAHRFCPERGYDTSVSGPALRTVASEGRKFGMGCAIVSQRPAKVDKNVLSQCNTEIAMKVTNPRDVKALASSLEGLTDGMAEEIRRLPVGQAVVSHPDLRTPTVTEVRPRETRPDGDDTPVVADEPPRGDVDDPGPDPADFPDGDVDLPSRARDDPAPDEPDAADGDGEPDRHRAEPDEDPPEPAPSPPETGAPADPHPDDLPAAPVPDAPREAEDGSPEEAGDDPDEEAGDDMDEVDHDPALDAEAFPRDPASTPEEVLRDEAPPDDAPAEPGEADAPADDLRPADAIGELGAGLDGPPSEAPDEPDRTVAAVEEARELLSERDPRELSTDRLAALVGEVEDLLSRLARVGSRTPAVVDAHNGLAAELVRYRRVQAAREAREPTHGLLRR